MPSDSFDVTLLLYIVCTCIFDRITSDQIILDWDEALVEANRPVPDTEEPEENTVPSTLESAIGIYIHVHSRP